MIPPTFLETPLLLPKGNCRQNLRIPTEPTLEHQSKGHDGGPVPPLPCCADEDKHTASAAQLGPGPCSRLGAAHPSTSGRGTTRTSLGTLSFNVPRSSCISGGSSEKRRLQFRGPKRKLPMWWKDRQIQPCPCPCLHRNCPARRQGLEGSWEIWLAKPSPGKV